MKRDSSHLKSTAVIIACLCVQLMSCTETWKEKKFQNCSEMSSAFKNVDYDNIVEEFGKPKETFEHWNGYGCDGDGLAFEAVWSGVGVGGKDSRIFFRAYELSPGRLSAAYCCTVECE